MMSGLIIYDFILFAHINYQQHYRFALISSLSCLVHKEAYDQLLGYSRANANTIATELGALLVWYVPLLLLLPDTTQTLEQLSSYNIRTTSIYHNAHDQPHIPNLHIQSELPVR
ncbi:hypothetical protein MY3296_007392 [Beauveria thailandica]